MPSTRPILAVLLVLGSACASRRSAAPPDPAPALAESPPPANVCATDFQRIGEAKALSELAVRYRDLHHLAPRADHAVFVPGLPLVAHVDRETGELRVVPLDGGEARRVSAEVSPPSAAHPERRPGAAATRASQVRAGSSKGELLYREGVAPRRVLLDERGVVLERSSDPPTAERNAFSALRAAGKLPADAYVLPVSDTLAVVSTNDGGRSPMRLLAADTAAGTVQRATPAGLDVIWAPQRVDDRRVLFGAFDGRYYFVDLESLELTCATPPVPEGYKPGPFAVSSDGSFVVYAAARMPPEGYPGYMVGLVNLTAGTDHLLMRAEDVSALQIMPVPGQPRFVLAVRGSESTTFVSVDEANGAVRLTPELLGVGMADVSADGAVAFTREKRVTEEIPTSRPETVERPRNMGCDPVGGHGGGCGWVSNGCDWIWNGPCLRQIEPPDPKDGVYAFRL